MPGSTLVARHGRLEARARIIQSCRQFFIQGGYLEVDTPLLIPAPAPELHIDAIPCGDRYLQTSPELCMKRLLAAGYGRIFQICHCWRAGERGSLHHPEFTMLEWYRSHADYDDLMNDCEGLLASLLQNMGTAKASRFLFGGRTIDITPPWPRITVAEAFKTLADTDVNDALERGLFDEILVERIEPRLGQECPCFLVDFPAPLAALARLKESDRRVAERFELYIAGIELANAFSELTDQEEQGARFLLDKEKRRTLGKSDYPLPHHFLDALPHMPPSAGIALGIDRLVMILTDSVSIDEVVAFTPEEL
jgi:lysyl-tRNA synthetase class 2